MDIHRGILPRSCNKAHDTRANNNRFSVDASVCTMGSWIKCVFAFLMIVYLVYIIYLLFANFELESIDVKSTIAKSPTMLKPKLFAHIGPLKTGKYKEF